MGWFRSNRASADDVAELRAQVVELTGRLSAAEQANTDLRNAIEEEPPAPTPLPSPAAVSIADLVERLDALEVRVASVSTELANQLSEIAGELDDPPTERIDAVEAAFAASLNDAVSGIRTTTEALAAEQARYEIQFRADLAELADRTTQRH